MLTESQCRAVRWYIGDVEGEDPFWGDPKAYVTVNALFFPGLDAEKARVSEGKRLNPAILEDPVRLYQTLETLMSAFRPLPEPVRTFRVERYSDYASMREKGSRTCSFTSTSTGGFLHAYQDRVGIALMRFELPAGTPCIDMCQALNFYAKPDEAEILLPPGMGLKLTETAPDPAEMQILDANGQPPVVSVTAIPEKRLCSEERKNQAFSHLQDSGPRVLRALMAGEEPDDDDARNYIAWKESLTRRLIHDASFYQST